MAWEDSNAHWYLSRGHTGAVKGAAPLCWMHLWETRKWAIKRENGKDKSFAEYMMGKGSLNTIQTEKCVLSGTAFWHLAGDNCCAPTSRPWGYTCFIYWYGYGLWGFKFVKHPVWVQATTFHLNCMLVALALVLILTFITWVSGSLSVCGSTELKTSSARNTGIRSSATEDSNRCDNNWRCLNGNKKGNSSHT